MDYNSVYIGSKFNDQKEIETKFEEIQKEIGLEDEVFTYKNSIAFLRDLYEIKEPLGYGSFGLVVSGIEKKTQRSCAIKIIKKKNYTFERLNELRNEALILSSLTHKNIVEYYNMHESERIFILVMELLKGGTLDHYIKRKASNNEFIPPTIISTIMMQILEALQFIHSKNLIHNDIKPENIMLQEFKGNNIIKIMDFGVSTKLENSLGFCKGLVKGTYVFMAPEQISMKLVTKFVDIWASGIILYLLFTNQNPFYAPNDTYEMVYQNILKGPNFPNNFPKIARDFFSKLCSIKLEGRLDASSALRHPFITGKQIHC